MTLEIGRTYTFKVDRKTDIGYMLLKDDQEVFLHVNESLHRTLNPGDLVDAFLYLDFKGRMAATLKESYISVERPALLRVKDIHFNLGVFLDMGISKDLLLSIDDLPFDQALWPKINDRLYVKLYIKGKMVAKLAKKEEEQNKNGSFELKQKVFAYVQHMGLKGYNLITEDEKWIFIHQSLINKTLRLGEQVQATITYISPKGVSGSLIEQKERKLFTDANLILSELIRHDEIPFDSNSNPEDIKNAFHMSKKAFKRAIGHLYKERKIKFVDGKTVLVKDE